MFKINKKSANSLILSLFIFQFGFLQPVATIIGNQMPIAIFSFMLVVAALLLNKFIVSKKFYSILLVSLIIFLVSDLFYPGNRLVFNSTFKEFLLKSVPALYIGSLEFDYNKLRHYIIKLSVVNFLLLFPFPFVESYNSMDYMRFGYALVPSTLVFIHAFMNEKDNFWWLVLSVISSYLVIIYGSRGPLIVLIIFMLLIYFSSNRVNRNRKLVLTFVGIIFIAGIWQFNVLGIVFDYLYFDLNIKNYTIMKYQRMFNNQFLAATSGRDQIYSHTFSLFQDRILFGHGIGGVETQISYKAHNIFLQILAENGLFGIFGLMYITVVFTKMIRISRVKNLDSYHFILVFVFSISIGRLLLSSDFWLRPEFWILLGLLTKDRSYFNECT